MSEIIWNIILNICTINTHLKNNLLIIYKRMNYCRSYEKNINDNFAKYC